MLSSTKYSASKLLLVFCAFLVSSQGFSKPCREAVSAASSFVNKTGFVPIPITREYDFDDSAFYRPFDSILFLSDGDTSGLADRVAKRFPEKRIVKANDGFLMGYWASPKASPLLERVEMDNTLRFPFEDDSFDAIIMRHGLCFCGGDEVSCAGISTRIGPARHFFGETARTLNKENARSLAILQGEAGSASPAAETWSAAAEWVENEYHLIAKLGYCVEGGECYFDRVFLGRGTPQTRLIAAKTPKYSLQRQKKKSTTGSRLVQDGVGESFSFGMRSRSMGQFDYTGLRENLDRVIVFLLTHFDTFRFDYPIRIRFTQSADQSLPVGVQIFPNLQPESQSAIRNHLSESKPFAKSISLLTLDPTINGIEVTLTPENDRIRVRATAYFAAE